MKVFDVADMKVFGYEQRAMNVIEEKPEFKIRSIELAPGGCIPQCEMVSHVIFICLIGEATVTINGEDALLSPAKGVVSDPARVAIKSETGAKLLGIQIRTADKAE